MGTRIRGHRAGGFTLLEVLVALVIAGLALAVLVHGGIDGLVAARVAGRTEEAVARAQSRIAALCHGTRLVPGMRSGDDGSGFAWRAQVLTATAATLPHGSAEEQRRPLRATLYTVRVTVSWGGTLLPRQVSLATSCLGPRAGGSGLMRRSAAGSCRRRHPAGFTLLELLAALAVFGLLLLALGQGLQFGLQAWRLQARTLAWPDDMEALDRTLRRLVTSAVGADEIEHRGPFIGEPGSLDVVTRLSRPDGGLPAPAEARLEVDSAHRLVLRLVPRPHVRWQIPPHAQLLVLAERIERIEFAYWQADPGGGGAWQRSWPGPDPPALIRMRLLFPRGDTRRWPDIIAAPALGALAS